MMITLYTADPVRYPRMTTGELRASFLVDSLFRPDEITLIYTDVDRAVLGSAVPVKKSLHLGVSKALAADYFCQRRELGVLNIGASGTVTVDGTAYRLSNKDVLYIGRGSREIVFESEKRAEPARFYLLSYPAHATCPTSLATRNDAEPAELGSLEASNKRIIYKMIHPGGIKSCQLVMGYTELAPGSVWNTMPPHTHERRMEIYLYFDMEKDVRVFHLMGPAHETRHLVIADAEAVVSPSWSVHSGAGTGAYTFCWGMGGENQEFSDMDHITIGDIR